MSSKAPISSSAPGKHSWMDYEFVDELASGGFGKVFLMQLRGTKTLRIIQRLHYNTDALKKIADEEVENLINTQSKFTVEYIESFVDKADLCVVLENLPGGTLRDYMTNTMKKMELVPRKMQTIKFSYQILQGLKHLHKKNVVYRDLKPENILIDENGNLKIADFNFAQRIASRTLNKTAGTCNYTPPEALVANAITFKSDVWQLGVIIIEMVTGLHPYAGKSMEETITNIKKQKMIKMPIYVMGDLKEMLQVMINQDPNKRPSVPDVLMFDVMELQEQIEQFVEEKRLQGSEEEGQGLNNQQQQELLAKIRQVEDERDWERREKEREKFEKEKERRDREKLNDERDRANNDREIQRKRAEEAIQENNRLKLEMQKNHIYPSSQTSSAAMSPKMKGSNSPFLNQPITSPIPYNSQGVSPTAHSLQQHDQNKIHKQLSNNTSAEPLKPIQKDQYNSNNQLNQYQQDQPQKQMYNQVSSQFIDPNKILNKDGSSNSINRAKSPGIPQLKIQKNISQQEKDLQNQPKPDDLVSWASIDTVVSVAGGKPYNQQMGYTGQFGKPGQFVQGASGPQPIQVQKPTPYGLKSPPPIDLSIPLYKPKSGMTVSPAPPKDPNVPWPLIPNYNDCQMQGMRIVHTPENSNICVVAYNPVITSGVYRFEGVFDNTSNFCMIGIADSSVVFDPNIHPGQYKGRTLTYASSNGFLQHMSFPGFKGNQEFVNQQRIAAEIDMNYKPRRVHFFVDDQEQRNSVYNIPAAVRFLMCIYNPNSSFTLLRLDRIQRSSVRGANRSRAMEWGKLWDDDD
ncbi:MAG: putative aurora kinase [Streblomastix strix]|uniref:non-specific serine/threonine protein kinase n=1 Tax=Streblomastix strix TaxID=222440 RepID=A0A5J4WQT8_9EUKA|nr:MAG: putative aurora kinase [Streblomastix strix]